MGVQWKGITGFIPFGIFRVERGRFLYKFPISSITKICPVGAALMQTDGRTDMTMLVGAFRYLCEELNKRQNWIN